MSHSVRQLRTLTFSCLALALIAAVLRTIALLTAFDADPGYFRTGTFLPIFVNVILLASVVGFVVLTFLIKKGSLLVPDPAAGLPVLCTAGITAALFVVLGGYLLFAGGFASGLLRVLAGLFSLVAAGYFALPFFRAKPMHCAILGCSAVLASIFILLATYFDQHTQMNAPHKTSVHFCLLAVMLYLVYELRARVGVPAPRAQTAFAAIAVLLCGTMGLSNFIAFLAGAYTNTGYLLVDLLILAFGVHVGARLTTAALTATPEET